KNESVSFADGMPYLLIGQASLDDLNSKLEHPVPMDRFRPNFVFSGGEAFEEDDWEKVKIGDAVFKITKPCARCVMTTIDQETGKKYKEPLKTLSGYRSIGGKVMFGQNMSLLEGKKIRAGDQITIYKK
uniref:MOSC domain-containing protein n=1 Tax=Aquiflexum sp. TaxID=1872584 RepID=UPI003593BCFE